jgi:hypothetical protein
MNSSCGDVGAPPQGMVGRRADYWQIEPVTTLFMASSTADLQV